MISSNIFRNFLLIKSIKVRGVLCIKHIDIQELNMEENITVLTPSNYVLK